MERNKPFISVVMPVYNVEKHLKKAVESVLKQSFQDFEIILVDDCSPDGCPQLCEKLAADNDRVKVVHHNKNQGIGMARNTGITEACGQYIWFIDSDDYVDDGLFEKAVQSLKDNPAEVVVCGLTEDYYDEYGRLHHSKSILPEKKMFSSKEQLRPYVIELEKKTLYGYVWNKFYNLAYLKEKKIKFEKSVLNEDIFFNVKYFMDIETMNIIDFDGYHYNKRMDNSLTSKFVPEYYKLHRKRIELIYQQYQYWDLCDEKIKAILGALYTRYIFSAVQRNCDKRANMSFVRRRKWIKRLLDEPLVTELIPYAVSEGKLLEIMIRLLKRRSVSGIAIIGRVIYICKNIFPMLFTILKQKR